MTTTGPEPFMPARPRRRWLLACTAAAVAGAVMVAAGTVGTVRAGAQMVRQRHLLTQTRQGWADGVPVPDGVAAIVHVPVEHGSNRTVEVTGWGVPPARPARFEMEPKHPWLVLLSVEPFTAGPGPDPVSGVGPGDLVWVETSWAIFAYRVAQVTPRTPGREAPLPDGAALVLTRHLPDGSDMVLARPAGSEPKVRV